MLKKLIDWLFASAPVEEIPNTPPVITDVVEKPQPRPKKPRTTKRAAALVADKSKSQRKPKAKKYEVGKWYKWDGGKCPVDPKTKVDAELRGSVVLVNQYASPRLDWNHNGGVDDIIAFRIVEEPKPAKRKPTTKGAKTMAKKKGCKPKGK